MHICMCCQISKMYKCAHGIMNKDVGNKSVFLSLRRTFLPKPTSSTKQTTCSVSTDKKCQYSKTLPPYVSAKQQSCNLHTLICGLLGCWFLLHYCSDMRPCKGIVVD